MGVSSPAGDTTSERSQLGEGCFDAFNVPTALVAHNSGGIIPSC